MLEKELPVRIVLMKLTWRQHAGKDRHVGLKLDPHQAVDHRCRDKLMAVDAAVDDQATGDDGVEATAATTTTATTATTRQPLGQQRDLEGAGHLEELQAAFRYSAAVEFGLDRLGGAGDDVAVPGRGNDGDTPFTPNGAVVG